LCIRICSLLILNVKLLVINMQDKFVTGVNYWPARKAMYWWKAFDAAEVDRDFALLNACGIQTIRIFLTWEDFQPEPEQINRSRLDSLLITADLAYAHHLNLMPTFFCGHMSGVNWIPHWVLKPEQQPQRFPVYSQGRLSHHPIRNFYQDVDIIQAQLLQIQKVCSSLRGHPAVTAYDLGNEPSNCCIPPDRKTGRHWLAEMVKAIQNAHPGSQVTLGMHAEDLEEDRHLWPQDAALYCDFLSMHGYAFYLSWVDNEDVYLLPFLGTITTWLGGGAPVLFQEFGWPTKPIHFAPPTSDISTPLWSEEQIEEYYRQALFLLHSTGMIGALGWCFADYHPELYDKPPLDDKQHERYFGLTHWDGSVKPALATLGAWGGQPRLSLELPSWLLHEDPERYYDDPIGNLQKWFKVYKDELTNLLQSRG
jgi:endo-1,4-beta-mannosidase